MLQFRVELQEVKPAVWRRIQVPAHYTFWELHVAIQDAMGWTDTHLHEFTVHDPTTGQCESIGIPDEEWPATPAIAAGWEIAVAPYFNTPGTVAEYLYDFGDDWHHRVLFEGTEAGESGVRYPRCLDGAHACPPEDVGGPHGYDEFRAAIADPDHEEHDAMLQWVGGTFDPTRFSAEAVQFDDPRLRWQLAFEP